MSPSLVENPHVLIIGAGSTGLLIAQGLKKSGITSTVFEKTDLDTYKDRPRHWSMALHWGVDFLTKCLPEDVLADIRSIETDPTMKLSPEQEKAFPFVNGKTGEVIAQIPGESMRRVSRAKLRNLLSRGVDVQYGRRFKNVTIDGDLVTAHFEDGYSVQGDLLVGCDGAQSAVRASLLTPEESRLDPVPLIPVHIAVTYTREQALFIRNAYHPSMVMAPHPSQHTSAFIAMADAKDPRNPESWVFLLSYAIWGTHEQPKSNADRLQLVKSYAANYCEPFKSAIDWIPDDTWVPPDVYRVWTNPVKWDNHDGKITLSGDAVHPMSPYRGQGLNNALEDAFNYIEAVGKYRKGERPRKEIIDAYDAEALQRGKKEIDASNVQTYGTHHWDALMQSPMFKSGINKVNE